MGVGHLGDENSNLCRGDLAVIAVTKSEYFKAIDGALAIIEKLGKGSKPSADEFLKSFLAAIYDSAVKANVFEILAISGPQRTQLLLTLVIGKALFGRPDHARAKDLLELRFR